MCSSACESVPILSARTFPYRQLYPVLKQLEPLIGIWKHERNTEKPALYVFDWGTHCINSRKLCYDLPGQEPFVEPFRQVGPGKSGSVQHLDSTHCLLTVQTGTPRSPITKAVQAAAAVAVGGIPIAKRVRTHSGMLISCMTSSCSSRSLVPRFQTLRSGCSFDDFIDMQDQADDIMGTSPEGSFEFEMQRFMQVSCLLPSVLHVLRNASL